MQDRPVRVLLIEDNPGDRRLIQEFLRDAASEFNLIHADTLGRGLKSLAEDAVDVVLLDLSLPDSRGLETFERAHQEAPRVPIVVLSGLADQEVALAAVRAGAQDYLVKGHVDENLLERAIHYAIERERLEGAQRFLAEASRTLSTSLDDATTLQRVAELSVPVLGDRCIVNLVDESGGVREAAVAAPIPEQTEVLQAYHRTHPIRPDDARHPVLRAMSERAPELYDRPERLKPGSPDRDAPIGAFGEIGAVSGMVVPLIARDRVLGTITFLAVESGRSYTGEDREVAADLAQRAALAIDNAQLYRQARDAIRVRDLVLSSVAHDLRAPLTPIKLVGETLRWQIEQSGIDNADTMLDGLRTIDRSVEKIASQIDELLDVARLQMGREVRLQRRRANLVPLVRAQIEDYQARTRRHQIRAEFDSDPLLAWFDPRRIERVIGNLLSNAIKYSPAGGEIVARVRRADGPGEGWAVVEVQDFGLGIPAADLPRLFTWFFRSERVAADIPGTGIGLAGSARIVELHGGVLTARSVEGQGSTFAVQLPLGPPVLQEPTD